jgi:hypothetical protein
MTFSTFLMLLDPPTSYWIFVLPKNTPTTSLCVYLANTKMYLVISVGTKPPPRYWNTPSRVSLSTTKSLPGIVWLAMKIVGHKGSRQVPNHLNPAFYQGSFPQMMEVSMSLVQRSSMPLHTKLDVAGESSWLQGSGTPRDNLVHSRTSSQGTIPRSYAQSWASQALSLTKYVLNIRMWSICSWMTWRCFFNVCVVSRDSSNLKEPGVRRIYRPQTP